MAGQEGQAGLVPSSLDDVGVSFAGAEWFGVQVHVLYVGKVVWAFFFYAVAPTTTSTTQRQI